MMITQKIYQEINSLSEEEQDKVFQFILVLKLKMQSSDASRQPAQTAWDELEQIGSSISKKWNPQISATQMISDLRR